MYHKTDTKPFIEAFTIRKNYKTNHPLINIIVFNTVTKTEQYST